MTCKIDPELCTGDELCCDIAPGVFEMDGDIAKVIVNPVPKDQEDAVREAIESCPSSAIIAED